MANLIPRTIYMYWNTGWQNAPAICKQCRMSWQKRNPTWRVVSVDNTNLLQHVPDMPKRFPNVCTAQGKPRISIQSFSDVLRLSLLARHGGVWVDATVFCVKPLDTWLSKHEAKFFAFSKPTPEKLLSSWFLASTTDAILLKGWFARVERYWKKHSRPHTYFWVHLEFNVLCQQDANARKLWSAVPKISADGPHAIQHKGGIYTSPIPPFLRNHIAQHKSPVYKLNWKLQGRAAKPNMAIGLLYAGLRGTETDVNKINNTKAINPTPKIALITPRAIRARQRVARANLKVAKAIPKTMRARQRTRMANRIANRIKSRAPPKAIPKTMRARQRTRMANRIANRIKSRAPPKAIKPTPKVAKAPPKIAKVPPKAINPTPKVAKAPPKAAKAPPKAVNPTPKVSKTNVSQPQVSPRWAVFAVANAGYFPYAMTAVRLLSTQIQLHHPNHACFIVSAQKPNAKQQRAAKAWNITFLQRNFTSKYAQLVNNTKQWPSECAWYFEMPQYFATLGFTHSVCLDGDVACVKPVHFTWENDPTFIMAAKRKPENNKINSGIVWFHNEKMRTLNLSQKVSQLIEARKGQQKKLPGDQDILNMLVEKGTLKLSHCLDDRYNYIVQACVALFDRRNRCAKHKPDAICIYHLIAKPWSVPITAPCYRHPKSKNAKVAHQRYNTVLNAYKQF